MAVGWAGLQVWKWKSDWGEGHRENVSDQLLENLIELQLLIVHHLQQLRQGGWIILGYLADATYSQTQTISLAYNKQPQYYRRWWSKLVNVGRVSTTSAFGTVVRQGARRRSKPENCGDVFPNWQLCKPYGPVPAHLILHSKDFQQKNFRDKYLEKKIEKMEWGRIDICEACRPLCGSIIKCPLLLEDGFKILPQ